MPYITPKPEQIKYIVGIDFGHGETSAAYCSFDANTISPVNIELAEGKHSIPTAICQEPGELAKITLGYQAVNAARRNPHSLFSAYFKSAPQYMNENERLLVPLFMREVYKEIRSRIPLLTDDNHVVFIACPSSSSKWNEEAKKEYADIAAEAGLPIFKAKTQTKELIGIIRESRAAFLQLVQDSSLDTLPKECLKNVLVVDFGSSTIDITYHEEGESPIDRSFEYGAQNVEKGIYSYFENLEKNAIQTNNLSDVSSNLEMLRVKYPYAYQKAIFDIRKQKEDFYSGDADSMEVRIKFKDITDGALDFVKIDKLDIYSSKGIDVEIEEDRINDILGKTTRYIDNIRNCFIRYNDELLQDKKVSLLVVTGGASRMPFVRKIATKVFMQEGTIVAPPQDPSLSVSRGLACAGKCDINLYRLIKDLTKSDKVCKVNIASEIFDAATNAIRDKVIECFEVNYSWFKNRKEKSSLEWLEQEIKNDLSKHDYSQIINDTIDMELEKYANSKIKSEIKNFTTEYFPYIETAPIGNYSNKFNSPLSISSKNLSAIKDAISTSEKTISEGVLLLTAKIVQGVAAGAVGFVGAGVAAVYDVGLHFAGKLGIVKEPEKHIIDVADTFLDTFDDMGPDFRDKKTLLSSDQRSKVYNSFIKEKGSYKTKLAEDIKATLKKNDHLKNQINQHVSECLIKYIMGECEKIQAQLI